MRITKNRRIENEKLITKDIDMAKANASVRIGKYKHYKGNTYQVIGTATNTEVGRGKTKRFVTYHPEGSPETLYVRPILDFLSIVNLDSRSVKRFTKLGEKDDQPKV